MRLSSKNRKLIQSKIKAGSTFQEIVADLELDETLLMNYLSKIWPKAKIDHYLKNQTPKLPLLDETILVNFSFKDFFFSHYQAIIFLLVIVFLVYANSLFANFLSDDIYSIVNQKDLGTKAYLLENSPRVLRPLLYYVTVTLFGKEPFFFHLENIFFHFFTVLGLYLLLSLLKKQNIAFWASLLFAVHPVLSEAVTWISGGVYPQYSSFLLFTLIFYLLSLYQKKYSFLSIISCLFSILSSEKALPLIFILTMFEFCFINLKKNWLRLTTIFFICFIFILIYIAKVPARITELSTTVATSHNFVNPLFLIPVAIANYLILIFFPLKLSFYHSEMHFALWQFIVFSLILVIYLLVTIREYFKNKFNFFFLSWFFFTLIPVLTPFGISWIVAERYVYLATAGITIIFTNYFFSFFKKYKQKLGQAIFIVIVLLLAGRTMIRNFDFKNADTLWLATAKTSPSSHQNHNNLGDLYGRQGNKQKALEEFQQAINLKPDYAHAHHNLAHTYQEMGDFSKAITHYQMALKYDQSIWQSYLNLADIYLRSGEKDRAREILKLGLDKTHQANLQLALDQLEKMTESK